MEEGIRKQTTEGSMRRTQSSIAGLEDGGREPRAKEYRRPLEAGRGKEAGPPLELPERQAVLSKL